MRTRLILGSVLLLLGVLWLLDVATAWDAGDVLGTWWPMLIVLLGVLALAERPPNLTGATFFVLVGGLLQLWRLDVLEGDVGLYVWPVLLILVGVALVAARKAPTPRPFATYETRMADDETVAVFSDVRSEAGGKEVRGGKLTAVFGRLRADLRGAKLPEGGARIEAVAAFGELDITVPPDWNVVVHGTPVFGGIEDRAARGAGPTLDVKASSVFGGVRIHN